MTLKLKANGVQLDLRVQENLILLALLGQPRLSHDDIVEILWPNPNFQPDGWALVIRACISRIRAVLKEAGAPYIIKVRYRKGYQLV